MVAQRFGSRLYRRAATFMPLHPVGRHFAHAAYGRDRSKKVLLVTLFPPAQRRGYWAMQFSRMVAQIKSAITVAPASEA